MRFTYISLAEYGLILFKFRRAHKFRLTAAQLQMTSWRVRVHWAEAQSAQVQGQGLACAQSQTSGHGHERAWVDVRVNVSDGVNA